MIAPWITVDDLEDQDIVLSDPDLANAAIESASYILWLLSARKFGGVRTTTESYCQQGLEDILVDYPITGGNYGSGWQVYPIIRQGSIENMIGGCCSDCGCPHLIRLRGGPVLSVEAVYVGDRLLGADEISIYDYSYISVAKDGCWGGCDDITVSYTYGAPPPAVGKRAAKEMADQYILAAVGADECALPARVTQVTRQGLSWTLLDPQDFLDKGLTGMYLPDLFLRAVNPNRALLRARVFSPDIPRGKTRRSPTTMPPAPDGLMASYGTGTGGGGTTAGSPMLMTMPPPVVTSSPDQVTVYEGRPLRWVVPGSFSQTQPPVVVASPSGEEVPPDALLWRTNNYTLDLTSDQAARLLPPGSALVVQTVNPDGVVISSDSYPVERRTAS